MLKKVLKYLAVTLIWATIWEITALVIDNPLIFPAPIKVLQRLWEMMLGVEFYNIILHSLIRILTGTLIAIALGIVLAIITSYFSFAHTFVMPAMTVLRSAPVASFIFLLLLFIGREKLISVISCIIVLPIVWGNVETGIKNTDTELKEMAKAYRMSPVSQLKNIYIPSVMPYFLTSVRSSIGMAWKAGIAAEVLTVPLISIGKMIYQSKQDIEPTDLFAWTLTVILLSLLVELLMVFAIKKPTEKYLSMRGIMEDSENG